MFYITENYLLFCTMISVFFALWSDKNTWVWAILGFIFYCLWVNKESTMFHITENYLLFCAMLGVFFALWSDKNTWVWAIIGFVFYCLWVNKTYLDVTDMRLYYIRAFIAFFTALIFILFMTKFSLYQAFIQLLILCAYGALEYDIAQGAHILIYNNYEAVIYGLVASQFIAILPELWTRISNYYTSHIAGGGHSKRFKRI